jgi:hypothetical protein
MSWAAKQKSSSRSASCLERASPLDEALLRRLA